MVTSLANLQVMSNNLIQAVGIATLHSMGIIHRDIKPENILIDFYGNIQIADFGISMVADSCEPCLNGKKYCWERVGTWPYAAPEVTVDEKPLYGLEIDYWALGCIAFEMEAWGHQVSSTVIARHAFPKSDVSRSAGFIYG